MSSEDVPKLFTRVFFRRPEECGGDDTGGTTDDDDDDDDEAKLFECALCCCCRQKTAEEECHFWSECIARFFFLLFYGLISVCGADGCARARHKTSVDGKNTLKFVSCLFFLRPTREKKETLFHSYIWTY